MRNFDFRDFGTLISFFLNFAGISIFAHISDLQKDLPKHLQGKLSHRTVKNSVKPFVKNFFDFCEILILVISDPQFLSLSLSPLSLSTQNHFFFLSRRMQFCVVLCFGNFTRLCPFDSKWFLRENFSFFH